MKDPFTLCTVFLQFLADTFHTTYARMSVYFNIYLQGGVLFLCALMLLIAAIRHAVRNGMSKRVLAIFGYATAQILFVGYACFRYRPPLETAFNRCYTDLMTISFQNNYAYAAINLLIFVIFYIAILTTDIYLSCRLLRHDTSRF